ncbi:MAG: alpha/beta fold hydrolase [Sulfitobacter sp.]
MGQGPRRALALHCTLAFGGAWAGVTKALSADMTLVAPDMPSHGQSADWDEISDFSDTVYAAALSVLEDAPMDIIGHSFGAMTALRLAVHVPDRVRSLTLIEPVFFAVASRDAPETMGEHDSEIAPFIGAMVAGDRPLGARLFNRMWSRTTPWDAIPERSRVAMTRAIHVVPDTVGLLYDDNAGLLEPGILDAVEMPTLLIRGSEAAPCISAIIDGLERRLPNALQVVIDQAGHMAPITHPVQVANAIRGLLLRS